MKWVLSVGLTSEPHAGVCWGSQGEELDLCPSVTWRARYRSSPASVLGLGAKPAPLRPEDEGQGRLPLTPPTQQGVWDFRSPPNLSRLEPHLGPPLRPACQPPHASPLPPPATGSVHFGVPGQASQAGRSAGVGRGGWHPRGPAGERQGEKARTRCPGAPKRAAGFRVRIRRTPTPPTYSSRPRRIQLPDRAQTTTPTMPRGNYTSRNAPLRAPAQ